MCLLGIRPSRTRKYDSGNGLVSSESALARIVDPVFRQKFANILNARYAYGTWRQVNSAMRKIEHISSEYNVCLDFPWDESKQLNFLLGCEAQGLVSKTVTTLMSRVRMVHKVLGHGAMPVSPWCDALIKGMGNTHSGTRRPTRLAVTPDILYLIKQELRAADWPELKKRLVWMVASWLFAASLRPGEALVSSQSQFVNGSTLMYGDVRLEQVPVAGASVWSLLLELHDTKEMRGKGSTIVEMFSNSTYWCPVKSYRDYIRVSGRVSDDGAPMMMLGAKGYTQVQFNSDNRALLSSHFDYRESGVYGHSFRSGIATALARAGFSDQDIMTQGRWSSSAFQAYLKRGRATRLGKQWEIAKSMVEMSNSWVPGQRLVV